MKKEKFLGHLYFPGMESHKEYLQHWAIKLKTSKRANGEELLKAVNEALLSIERKQVSTI